MSTPQICIVGAGISGLVLGRCLLRQGVRAILFEKSKASQTRNTYGITLHCASYRPLLAYLGIEESTFRKTVAVDAMNNGTGRLSKINNEKSFRANRSRVEKMLAEGLDIRYDHQFKAFHWPTDSSTDPPEGLTLRFKNGLQYRADFLIGADGVHSEVRKSISPETSYKVLPYAVYNGKRRIPRGQFNSKLQKYFQDGNTLQQRIIRTVLQISVDDYSDEEVSVSYTYSRPAKASQDPLYNPNRSNSESRDVPEALYEEIDAQGLEEPYQTIFNTAAMRKGRMLNWLMRTLQGNRDILDPATKRQIILMGDAIHAGPILGGNGANEAIEDGMKLAGILVDNQKLDHYYQLRFDDWTAGVTASERRILEMHYCFQSSL